MLEFLTDAYRALWGSGKVRFEIENEDGTKHEGTAPFSGSFDTEEELMSELINEISVECGYRIKRIRILGVKGTTTGDCKTLSGNWFTRK